MHPLHYTPEREGTANLLELVADPGSVTLPGRLRLTAPLDAEPDLYVLELLRLPAAQTLDLGSVLIK